MKNQKGFSLIELLIVVVIIGIIAAIAIPNLLASRRAANEGSAASSMRTFHGANTTYQATEGAGKYAQNVAALTAGTLIDPSLGAAMGDGTTYGSAPKSGYVFAYDGTGFNGNPSVFSLTAKPASDTGVTATGTRSFLVAESGVIYSGAAATVPTVGASPTRTVTNGSPLNN